VRRGHGPMITACVPGSKRNRRGFVRGL
jgi:hypothetical protein